MLTSIECSFTQVTASTTDIAWYNVWNEKLALQIALHISNGMVHLANKGFVHRDLAARNILIKDSIAKVADFGLCRNESESMDDTYSKRLPIKWMALEALQRREFSSKSDVYETKETLEPSSKSNTGGLTALYYSRFSRWAARPMTPCRTMTCVSTY